MYLRKTDEVFEVTLFDSLELSEKNGTSSAQMQTGRNSNITQKNID
jgi:hypothetical protein